MAKIDLQKRSGKRSKVREKSVKSQGILKTILSGNPVSMRAISSEILRSLKVKLPLQNDQRWLLLLSWFFKIFRGKTPAPLPDKEFMSNFSIQHCMLNPSLRLKLRFSTLGLKRQE